MLEAHTLPVFERKKVIFALIIGVILFLLLLPPFRLFFLSWIMITPLLLLMSGSSSLRRDVGIGCLVGVVFVGIGVYWLLYYSVWVYMAVVASFIPFFTLFFGITGWFLRKFPNKVIVHFFIPSMIWVALSLIYERTPVGATGTQAFFYQPIEWMQMVHWTGMHGIVFLLLMVNSAVAIAIRFRGWRRFVPLALSIPLLLASFFLGRAVLAQPIAANQSVALVQHNLPADKAWWIRNHQTIKNTYQEMAMEAAEKKPKLIVFPSFALPFDSYRDPKFFEALAKKSGTHLLIGTYIPSSPKKRIADVGLFEMALLYSPEGKLVATDTSVQAPPFRNIGQVVADEANVFNSPIGNIGTLLCFEDSMALLAKAEVSKGAEILVSLSNPGFFNKTFLPEYHLYQDQLRAIETGRFVIRVSAKGYSAIIDPRGRLVQTTKKDERTILYGLVGNE